MKKYKFLILIMLIATSCGSKKALKSVSEEDMAARTVVQEHYSAASEFNTLQGKMHVDYESPDRSQNLSVSFRMKKNDTIWLSGQLLGIPLAKVLITPNSVKYYEKITQTYFDGDFQLLSDFLGIPLDFEKVQNLLLGHPVDDLRAGKYVLEEAARGYQLEPAEEMLIRKLFLLDRQNYRLLAQQLSDTRGARSLMVNYPDYSLENGYVLPDAVEIVANEGTESTRIYINYRNMEFNVPLSFPFSIPSGYEEIVLQ